VVLAVWVTACSFEVASSEGKLVGRLLVIGESAIDVLSPIGFIELYRGIRD
jgi:hypothetical protein